MSVVVLRELDKFLYVVSADSMYDEPAVQRLWYPTEVRTYDAERNWGPPLIGQRLDRLGDGRYRIEGRTGLEVRLPRGGATKAAVIEKLPYPMPKTRKKGPFHYQLGRWYRWGERGHEDIIDRVNLYEMVMK